MRHSGVKLISSKLNNVWNKYHKVRKNTGKAEIKLRNNNYNNIYPKYI